MRRWVLPVAGLILVVAACDSSPTSPSGDAALRVQVLDERTGMAITDSVYRLELQLTAPGGSYTQPVVNGAAQFSGIAPAEYRLTTNSLFGYLQLDLLTLDVEGSQTMTLRLTPIDDLGVEQVSVDGLGSIPKGGTIAIPVRGVTLRLRGRYQSPRSPWPAQNEFSANIPSSTAGIDGVGHEGGRSTGDALSPTEFEIAVPNWTPCTRFADGRLSECFTSSDILVLTMSTPFIGGFGGSPLVRKSQQWPLKYELAPDCCLP